MKFSDDFLSIINRTSDSQFGTGDYGHIDDEYVPSTQEQDTDTTESNDESDYSSFRKGLEAVNKAVAFMTNPIPTAIVGSSKAAYELFKPTKDSSGKTTTLAEQALNINTRDALSLNVTSRQKELMDTEGKWLPEIEEAQNYIQGQKEYIQLQNQLKANPQNTDLIQASQQKLEELLKLQEDIKEKAKTNPYLSNVFYGAVTESVNPLLPSRTIEASTVRNQLAEGKLWAYYADLSWKQNNIDFTQNNPAALSQLEVKAANLQKQLDDAKLEYDSKSTELKDKQQSLKTAHWLHDPLFGVVPMPLFYNPDTIDPVLDRKRSEVQISALDPSTWQYGLLHIGSSASELQGMGWQMLTALGIKYGTKLGGSPLAWAAGEAVVNSLFTQYFRHKETAGEIMSNYVEKLATAAADGKFDLSTVLNDYIAGLKAMGYDTDKMDEMETLQFGLAYNIPTKDNNYNTFAKDARKGLTQLEETNNALALGDYAENLGLSYGGKLLNKSIGFKAIMNKAVDLATKNKITAALLSKLNSKIDKAAVKLMKSPVTRMKAKHVRDAGTDMALALGKRWLFESTEEGQQGMMGRWYQDLPDNAQVPDTYNIFRGAATAGRLALEANLAYRGMHWDDKYNTDEQLKIEMGIGGFIGALMGSGASLTNINDIRHQLQGDNVVRALAAKGFENAENNFKIAQFLDYSRKGKDINSLTTSLEDFKKYKTEGVTDDMIDDDIRLAKDVSAIYRNKLIDQNLKDIGVDRKKDKFFERFVQTTVSLYDKQKDASSAKNESDKRISDINNSIINNEDVNDFNSFINSEYEAYADAQRKQNAEPITKQQFKSSIVNAVSSRTLTDTLTNLKKDLTSRKKTLEQLKDEYGIQVSTTGVEGMLKYINDSLKDLQGEQNSLRQKDKWIDHIMSKAPDFGNKQELEQEMAINALNTGILSSLNAQLNAYTTGRLSTKDRYLVESKPIYSNLSDEDKQNVLQKYSEKYKQQHSTDEEPTKKQVIAYYNKTIQDQWSALENDANVEQTERFLANSLFLSNNRRDIQEETQAKTEIEQETGHRAAENDGEQTSEQLANDKEQSDTQEKVIDQPEIKPQVNREKSDTPDEVNVTTEHTEQNRTTAQAPVDSVDSSTQEQPPVDEVQLSTQEDVDRMLEDTLEQDPNKILMEDSTGILPEDRVETDTPTEASELDRVSDDVLQEDAIRAKLEQVEDGQPIVVEDGVEPDTQDQTPQQVIESTVADESPQPTVEEQDKEEKTDQPIEVATAKQPDEPTKVIVTAESFDGSNTQDVTITIEEPSNMVYSDGTDVWVGNEDPSLGTHIEDSQLALQNAMEELDSVDLAATTRAAELLGQSDKSPGLDSKKKVETNRIHSTFFFACDNTEVMPIQTQIKGKSIDVKFNGTRMPGSELSKKLAIPGWLSKQKVYYIVTDSKETRKLEKDAADRLAVHMIIEENVNGKKYIYNAALYTPDKARVKIMKWNVPLYKQHEEVRKLRELRREIISKYIRKYAPNYFNDPNVNLPTVPQDGIVPVNLRQSNGSINSQQDGNNPIYRSLTSVPEFGLSVDPYEMSDQILSGEVEFGYGKGPFPLDPADAFTIVQFDGSTKTSAQGTGYAGKLYIIPKVANTPSQRVSAPIMLSEKRHFIPGGSSTLVTSYTPNGKAKYDDNGKRIPLTSAELVFRLVTDTLQISNQQVYKDVLNILCNHGPSTITLGDSRVEKLSFYVRKTLHTFQNEKGETFLMYGSRTPEGIYTTKYLRVKDAKNQSVFSEAEAWQTIRDISNNIHWNTDKKMMQDPIPDSIVETAIEYMNEYKTDYYRVLNCDDLIFTMQDLGLTKNDKGEVVRAHEEAPILMSWMINHQVIKTSVGEQAFKDPFIYADGAQEVGDPTPVTPTITGPTTTETPRKDNVPAESTQDTEVKQEAITPASKPSSKDKLLSKDEVLSMGLTPKPRWEYILKEDGTTVMLPSHNPIVAKLKKSSGLYSTTKGRGKFDEQKARKWLKDKLGLDIDNVFVTGAVMRMADAPEVYGLMKVSFNRIFKEFNPQIVLSEQAGQGIEYHEAFHYVSQLILSEEQRNQVYSDYIKAHPEYKGYTKDQMEEVLAEEFRTYMINESNISPIYRMKKFFKALWNLVTSFRNRPLNAQQTLFQAIRSGKFRNSKPFIGQEILSEFAKRHPEGMYYYAPGISDVQQKSTPHITNASTMYNIIESLSSTALATLNIRTMDDIRNLKLDDVFNIIQYNYDYGVYDENPTNKQIVEDVLKNKEIFAKQIRAFLQELGIKSIEKEETEVAEQMSKDTGDIYDNIWDRNSYEISKKANVAFNAKLFFYSIPKSKFILTEDGKITDTIKDPIFDMDVVQPFDITWNKILENLWSSNDWNDLLSKVRRLAKSDPFFATLRDYIDNPEYPLPENTITQLLTTIQSAKNSMDTIDIKSTANIDPALGKRTWEVLDSDSLRKIAMIPSQWSENFMLSTMITTDSKNRSVINSKALDKITKLVNKIDSNLDLIYRTKRTSDNVQLFEETKNDFLNLVNDLGINFDNDALTYLLGSISTKESTGIDGVDAFNLIFRTKNTDSRSGSAINSILHSVYANIRAMASNKSLETKFKGITISADKIFNYYDPNSVMNLMAIAYGETHPTPEEFSVTGADGSLVYPITQNNYMSDQIRWLNTNAYGKLQNLSNTPYCKNSLIVKALSGKNKPKLKLHTLLAIEDQLTDTSRDYFGITPLEDYITKLVLAENSRIVLPTMSDKKTWYSIEGIELPKNYLASVYVKPDKEGGISEEIPQLRKFNRNTLKIFYNYFVDEFNAITKYYNTKSDVEQGRSRYYSNYHGKIGKDGKMKPGGNGGRFRYFNQIVMPDGEIHSLNALLQSAEESNDPKLINETLENIRRLFIEDVSNMYDILNRMLLRRVDQEIEEAVKLGVISIDENGNFSAGNLPTNIYSEYKKQFKSLNDTINTNDAIYSIIANFTVNYAISIEEVEKCFVGDPAFYKWKSSKEVGIFQRDVDKIKRLSSVLSTGTNLRTYWGEGDPRNDTKFVSAVMQDNNIGSEYHDSLKQIFRASFIRTMLQKEHPDMTDKQLFDATKNEDRIQESYDSLSDDSKKFVDKQSEKAANPYAYDDENNSGNINQADAAVYIRPAMYKRIMQALGEWSPEIEEAYNILESSDDVLSNPELYSKALRASIKPLKMMYFGDHYDSVAKLNVPTFDKMALFPMFKILAKADNKYLYDRMNNEELGVIDMLLFESAVKVGAPQDKFKAYNDNRNTSFNKEGLNKPSTMIVTNGNAVERLNDGLTTRIQDIKQLRLQLSTDPHEHTDRSFGTQAIKIGMGNVVDDRYYGHNKGKHVSGSQIKKDIFGCIKALSTLGYTSLKGGTINGKKKKGRFFKLDGSIDKAALSRYLVEEATGNGMSQEIIDALKLDSKGNFKAPIAALSVRNWIESKIISLINKEVIDVNTPGGSAIQMASFGFKANDVITDANEDTRPFNDGKKLSFDPKRGSMEVMLSTNFFRDVVPQDVQEQGYVAIRKWLLDNNIIGSQSDPYGIGYRIPTQGLSSTFSFIVADVLPAQTGDTIVVPDEFTAMTGSDFDIDKLYIATYSYDPNTHQRYTWKEDAKTYSDQSKGALINKLLDSYTLVISDEKTLSETRASIDTLTGILTKEILPKVSVDEMKEADYMYELMPSFQEYRKMEYTWGKAGIAPFALNSTNHCLTQATHLHMKFSHNNIYGLGQFDEINGQDGFKILDWLSAMINAHVDVAKDPYIIKLNVNQVTYNMTSLLLRGGKGENTFFFLAQPILKEFANIKIANNGAIGSKQQYDNTIISRLIDKYTKMLNNYPISQSYKESILKITDEDKKLAFDKDKLSRTLDAFRRGQVTPQDIKMQLIVLTAYSELSGDAQTMADLVQRSQIDTKKYGNNITQLQNFYNSYQTFIKDHQQDFSTPDTEGREDLNGLEDYFNKTFLNKKLVYAMDLANNILKTQVFGATNGYKTIFTSIMHKLRGGDYPKQINNSLILQLYKPSSNKELVKKINEKVESIIRAKVVMAGTNLRLSDEELSNMNFGKNNIASRLNSIKNYIRSNNQDPNIVTLVDDQGNITNELLNYLQGITISAKNKANRIVTATSSLNNSRYYEDRLRSAFYDLLTNDDVTIREFAEDLVKYSFVSSYDNRTPNSFFNIVPMEYKQQIGYLDSIKEAMYKLVRNDIDIIQDSSTLEELTDSIYLNMVRNYWNDNDVVPLYIPKVEVRYGEESKSNTVYLASAKDSTNSSINTIFVAVGKSEINKNNKFVKIGGSRSTNSVLYQRSGQIIDIDGKTIGIVYVAIPKLGFNNGASSIYELYKNGTEQSAFENNKFTDTMIKQTVEDIDNIVYKYTKTIKDSQFVRDEQYSNVEIGNIQEYFNLDQELQNELIESFGDSGIQSDPESIDSDPSLSFVDTSDNSTTIEDFGEIDQMLGGIEEANDTFGEDYAMPDESYFDSTELVDDIIGSLQDSETGITEVNEYLNNLKEEGKKRKKHCKKS